MRLLLLLLLGLLGSLVLKMVTDATTMVEGKAEVLRCKFPAVYNFGDSYSDTGGRSAAFGEFPLPNGETFFGRPSGRACDGRLIIDFIAERLELPYLSAYLDSIGTDFRHGANFAFGGSTIRAGGYTPFDFGVQISQFKELKARTGRLLDKHHPMKRSNLPRPEELSTALYTVDIGQNDLAYVYQHSLSEEEVRNSIPDILSNLSKGIQQLYEEGARFFWVHNAGPIGCLPYAVLYYSNPGGGGKLDQNGCVSSHNDIAREFNRQLGDQVSKLKQKLPHAAITYVDVYSTKYQLISTARNQGFVNPMDVCCGSYNGYQVECGKKGVVNGTLVYGNACKNPSMHISWDGIHYSEAANLWVANRILNATTTLSQPLQHACVPQTPETSL